MARANALFMGALMAYACTRTKFIDYLKRAVILRKIIMVGGVCTLVDIPSLHVINCIVFDFLTHRGMV